MPAVKYTGNADAFNFEGTLYAKPELVRKNPDMYDHSYDTPIKGLSMERALSMAARSNLHSFELVNSGEDLLEKVTGPQTLTPVTANDESIVDPKAGKDKK